MLVRYYLQLVLIDILQDIKFMPTHSKRVPHVAIDLESRTSNDTVCLRRITHCFVLVT